ncbi:MAG: tetratricopeptide repeat protein [Dehalococcoidia bacterium]
MLRRFASRADAFFDGDLFGPVTGGLIAALAVIAALVAYLQSDAGSKADEAKRDAQTQSVQALGLRTRGEAEVAYAYEDAYRIYSEYDTLAVDAELRGDEAAAERYATVRDDIAELSEFLAPPYYDPEGEEEPDIDAFEAERFVVDPTRLEEHFEVNAGLDDAWDRRARLHVSHLTLLAVGLALFGLAATISSPTRRKIFFGTGAGLAGVALVWLALTLLEDVDEIPDTAIDAYAVGAGRAWQGDSEGAIDSFSEALRVEPGYGNALVARAEQHYNLGNYPEAIADYEDARQHGEERNPILNELLAGSYYLNGDLDKSIETSRRTLEQDPELLPSRLNLGLALLASGEIDEARAEYDEAMALATRRVNEALASDGEASSTLYLYLDFAAFDLENLAVIADGDEELFDGPPPEDVVNPEEVSATAAELFEQIKSLNVWLEIYDAAPGAEPDVTVGEFDFVAFDEDATTGDGTLPSGEDEEGTSILPLETQEVLLTFDYDGFADGQPYAIKVYIDGEEDPSLRIFTEWDLGPSGSAEFSFTYSYGDVFVFDPGYYEVELYVDSHLVQRGFFVVGE